MTLPVVVTMSMFQDAALLFIGMAPPPLLRKLPARRMSCMAWNGAAATSTSGVGSPGPLLSMLTPVETSSTWPSSSAKMQETRL
ncbi:hypothetical protein OPKNFCMD_6890 [Methylobacterium crusticola]|uniref:Secreted protein n=1 Tax=Methylobacterium crusticola TaxID=1697972 RepID=A0ABQ4R8U9_9HYPH|nr:hypothetical protein OPKNFCMD_6890 [Methylobacterium crusticola]